MPYIFLTPIRPIPKATGKDLRVAWEAGEDFYCHDFQCLISKKDSEEYKKKWSGFNLGNLIYIEFDKVNGF